MQKRKLSLVSTTLILTGSLMGMSHAAFVQPDLLATDSGEFAAKFAVANLIGEATSGSDTINGATNNTGEMYATLAAASNNLPMTITMDFTAATDLSAFYLWNSARASDEKSADNGIKDFTLTFYDAANGGGSQIGSIQTGLVAARVAEGDFDNAAQVFDFSGTYADVLSVKLTATTSYQTTLTNDWTGIREVGFDTVAVPEPSTTALLGLGGLTLILRRRK